ncbi:MAG TPA: zf-HC2 domain-containing protein [Bacteroidota bacterium]
MPTSPNIHWTQDVELLEQFILHRVEGARRKELEAHLLTCEECQHAVRDEQQLVLGIKRVGRDEMKARLKQRVHAKSSETTPRSAPWVRIASVAATLVVVFGLGIYNRWIPLGPKESQEQATVTEKDTQQQTGALEGAGEEAKQKSPVADHDKPDEAQPRQQDQRAKTESFERREPQSPRDVAAQPEAERRLDLAAPTTPSAAGAAAKQYDAQANELADKAILEKKDSPEHIWVDGIVIIGGQSTDDLKQAVPSEHREQRLRSAQRQQQTVQKANTAIVTVTELPLQDLPQAQHMKQQRLDQNTVQTMIEQQPDGNLNFVLYRQMPQQKLKTQNAMLEQIGADSLVIIIDGEQIGYKILGGLGALQQTKTKK